MPPQAPYNKPPSTPQPPAIPARIQHTQHVVPPIPFPRYRMSIIEHQHTRKKQKHVRKKTPQPPGKKIPDGAPPGYPSALSPASPLRKSSPRNISFHPPGPCPGCLQENSLHSYYPILIVYHTTLSAQYIPVLLPLLLTA